MSQLKFQALYDAQDIAKVWNGCLAKPVINHPKYGLISPYAYRAMYNSKSCPYCARKMVHGKALHSTPYKQIALQRGYEYVNKQGRKVINQTSSGYFHPNYVTLDHKTNKARCPEKMLDYSNLQIMCWRCNQAKGDDNTFELQHTCDYLDDLADEALARYPLL